MSCILCFLAGAAVSGVIFFLVWRNNKKKFLAALEGIDDSAITKAIKKLLKK